MSSILDLNQIYSILENIAQRHYQINSFGIGRIEDFDVAGNQTPPTLYVTVISGTLFKSDTSDSYPVKELTLELRVLDLVNTSKDNLNDVHSDTFQILSDVVLSINQDPYFQNSQLQLMGDVNLSPLEEWSNDNSSGWMCELSFRMKNNTAFCNLPMAPVSELYYPGYSQSGITYSSEGFLTCGTVTACTQLQQYIDLVVANANANAGSNVPGLNTYTGGTAAAQSINVSGLTIDNISVSGSSSFEGLSATTFYSGSTDLSLLFQAIGSDSAHTHIQNGTNTYTGGTTANPTVNVSALTISTLSVSGATGLGVLSATTIISGSTNLYNIFQTIGSDSDHTHIQNGTNTYTGGTANNPTVNISGATLSYLSANTISGGTIYSGSTNLYNIFQSIGSDSAHTHIQPGTNTYTGGTESNPTVNVSALTINSLTVSGITSLSSVSATTYYSGSTDISLLIPQSSTSGNLWSASTGTNSIIANNGTGNLATGSYSITFGGKNIVRGNYSSVGGSGNTIGALCPISIIGGGSTNMITTTTNGATIGGGMSNTVSSSASYSSILGGRKNTLSANKYSSIVGGSGNTIGSGSHYSSILVGKGNAITNQSKNSSIIAGSGITATVSNTAYMENGRAISSFSAATFYSGSTDISLLFGSGSGTATNVQNGLNTYTGGTASNPTVNVSGLTIDHILVSGSSIFDSITSNLIEVTGLTVNYQSYLGIASASTIYSGSTDLYNIFQRIGTDSDHTHVQPGTNTYTAGTSSNPTVNVSALTISTLSVSGATGLGVLSATTIYSGSTDLSLLFQTIGGDSNDITRVQPGTNTYTGGTANNPTVNVSALTISTLTVSGATSLGVVSATTYYSGSTLLSSLLGGAGFSGWTNDTGLNSIKQVGGGATAAGNDSISFGSSNSAAGLHSAVIGGNANSSLNTNSFIGGGSSNYSFEGSSAIIGGFSNQTKANYSTVIGGKINTSSGRTSSVIGGSNNLITKPYSTIIGGSGNTLTGTYSSIIGGKNITSSLNETAIMQNGIALTNFSAATYYSGSTDLSLLFGSGSVTETHVQNGLNTYTGGTSSLPTVNVSGLTINNITVSGSSSFQSLSAVTYYSGSTLLSTILSSGGGSSANLWSASTGTHSIIANNGSGNLSSGPYSITIGKTNIATTNYSTVLGGLLNKSSGSRSLVGNGQGNSATTSFTSVLNGRNNFVSGAYSSVLGGYGNTLTGAYSSIINGKNIVAGDSYTTIMQNGRAIAGFSAATYYSGTTLLSSLFASTPVTNLITAQLATKANLSGDTFTGQITAPSISGASVSATTYYSGSTLLSSLIPAVVTTGNYIAKSGNTVLWLSASPCDLSFAFSDETTQITTGTTKLTIYAPYAFTILDVQASLSVSGSATINTFNIKKNGTTIFSTKLTIDIGEYHSATAAAPAVITGNTVAIYDKITLDVDTIGTGSAGGKIYLCGIRTL